MDKPIYGGSSLGRIGATEGELAGKTVFAPFTLPGELVEAHIGGDKRGFVIAEADEILEPSLLRTTPACPYFGVCGGCSYQHAVYPHQLEMKTAILREMMERARIADPAPMHTLSGSPWRYRNRIRLQIQPSPFGLSYRQRGSHHLLRVDQCPIAAPLLEDAISVITAFGASLRLGEFCDEIELFTNGEEHSLSIVFSGERPGQNAKSSLASICQTLKAELPRLTGAGLFATRKNQPPRLIASWEQSSLLYRAAGFDYRVSLGCFFQVNRFLVDALVELVAGDSAGRVAWDLYAGVGLFARALTGKFERVIAVESAPNSAADLQWNMVGSSHRSIQATTLDFLRKQHPVGGRSERSKGSSRTPPDLIVVDPPRAGLGGAITSLLGQIGAPKIVYVSCDPATLSRDVAALIQSGYDLKTITMVDLFPQTSHLESVSVLMRR